MITVFNKTFSDMRLYFDMQFMQDENFCSVDQAYQFKHDSINNRFENEFYIIHFDQPLDQQIYNEIMDQAKTKGKLILLLDSHLFTRYIPKELNKFAQNYNFKNKVLKTHSSYNNLNK